jgi:hypothetical protein
LDTSDGKTVEWKNATIPAYQRRTKQADALIAGAYLTGTNTRRVRRALAALFGGGVTSDSESIGNLLGRECELVRPAEIIDEAPSGGRFHPDSCR